MRKIVLVLMMISTLITYAQKKTNGTIYIEHPAINTVEAFNKALVSGDADKVATFLTDDFKAFNGTDKNDKGDDKTSFLRGVKWWKDNVSYLSITTSKGAYPDALEYTDENQKDIVWVQTWDDLKGMHNKTGVKIDMPMHRLFVVDKNNKIKTITGYSNGSTFDEIGDSFNERKNGTIYNHHEYINKVRIMIHAFENKDLDKAYSIYDAKARFRDINLPVGETTSLEELKANDKKFLEKYDITSIDVSGYPDYLNYELGNGKIVQSWWNYKLIRKSDKKEIVLPVLFIHTFNDDGMIIFEVAYYSDKLLN